MSGARKFSYVPPGTDNLARAVMIAPTGERDIVHAQWHPSNCLEMHNGVQLHACHAWHDAMVHAHCTQSSFAS